MSKKSIINTISSEEFAQIVASHTSVGDILTYFGFSQTSGWMAKIVKDRILKENIDISHFNKGGSNKGRPKHQLEEMLVENSSYTNISRLKKRLVNEGLLEYVCAECGNTGEWNGKSLVLQLEHKNGKHNDHRLCNLVFLCPNCHSQTDTYAGKNANKTKTWRDNIS